MAASVLFTGFPGFLGSELLPRVLSRSPGEAVCLVQPKYAPLARARVEAIERVRPDLAGRVRLVEGDVVRPDLGLRRGEVDPGTVREIYHLAAVYDLEVGRERAQRVNVEGTRHVLDLARRCRGLERLHYVSTCYVSGRWPGVFREDDLERGQRFNNHYEETKHRAEVEVWRAMADGLPATVYRPSIVVGDSRTGATQKYDGPYPAIRLLLRQPRVALLPMVGDPRTTELNLVPRDFVVDAIAHLAALPGSAGMVYQLADPRPLTLDRLVRTLARATDRRVLPLRVPGGLAKAAVRKLAPVHRLLGIPAAAIDYFDHPTRYDTTGAQRDLAGSGIAVPALEAYVDRLVGFVRANPDLSSRPMA